MKRIFLIAITLVATIWLVINQSQFSNYIFGNARAPSGQSMDRMEQPGSSLQTSPAEHVKGLTVQIPELASLGAKSKQVQICGLGKIEVAEFPFRIPIIKINSLNNVVNSISRELAGSQTERDRALGLYLQATIAGDAADERARFQEPGCGVTTQAQGVSRPCSSDPFQASQRARLDAAVPLVELAQKTSDPNVYATAFHLCTSAPANARGVCAPITAEAWAQLDPDNFLPQVIAKNPGPHGAGHALAPANATNDEAEIRATRYNKRYPQFEKVTQHATFANEPAYMQFAIANWVLQAQGQIDFSGLGAIAHHCRAAETARNARGAMCRQLADVIARDGRSVSDLMTAITVSENAKVSANKLDQLKAERSLLIANAMKEMDDADQYSCDGMAKSIDQATNSLTVGQRRALKKIGNS